MRTGRLLLLFVASGAAGLLYEVLWLKELGRLFGATSQAAAATLAVFFLGIATGSLFWGRRARALANPLRRYAHLELAIAASALLYFLLLDLFRWLYAPLYELAGHQPLLLLGFKLLLATLILFPAAFFMGGTLPLMAQHLVRRPDELGSKGSLLYAANTLGAALGAVAGGFVLPRAIGFRNSYLVAVGLNVGVSVLAAWWSRSRVEVMDERNQVRPSHTRDRAGRLQAKSEAGPGRRPLSPALITAVAFLSGFLALALEVLWTRMHAQVLQNSVYTFAALLTVFLVALALGSATASFLSRRAWPLWRSFHGMLLVSGVLVGTTPWLFYHLTSGLQVVGSDLGWATYIVSVFGLVAAVVLVPGMAIGTVFPFLLKLSEAASSAAGETVGRLVAVNNVAAILGSLTAGFVWLDLLGLWDSVWLVAILYLLLALFAARGRVGLLHPLRLAPAAGIVLLVAAMAYTDFADAYLDAERGETLVEVWEGSQGTVAVTSRDSGLGIKVNNSYLLGTSGSALNARIQSWLPLALHPRPQAVFYLGMGTGISAGGALDLDVATVTVCELNADVVRAARAHFGPHVNGLFEDPRVTVLVEDGRMFLQGTAGQYDVIIADIFLTYRAGVGDLYTWEHFEAIRKRLGPGGIFALWLPMFEISREEFGIIARTLLEVFPQVTLWRRGFSPRNPVFALMGQMEPAPLDLGAFRARMEDLMAAGDLPEKVWLGNIPMAAYAGNLGCLRSHFADSVISTDDRIPLEYLAPVVERNSRGSGKVPVLAWEALAAYGESVLEAAPPETDPYLQDVSAAELRQVRAGGLFYRHETSRRLGQEALAAESLRQYRQLLGIAPQPPVRR